MSRSDWTAVVTEPAQEYRAATELERLGLRPYLAQHRRRWRPLHGAPQLRLYPLFPRYLLLPFGDSGKPALRHARGLRKIRPILADAEGRPWRAPAHVVDALMAAEARGEFDDSLEPGAAVTLRNGPLAELVATFTRRCGASAELLLPLLGGARAVVDIAELQRAAC